MTRPVVVDAVDRLRLAAERLADALASGQPDAVLACELPLVDALRGLRSAHGAVTGVDRDEIRRLTAGVHAAVARCRAMGDTVTAILTAAIVPQGYGRRGVPVPAPRRTISSRT